MLYAICMMYYCCKAADASLSSKAEQTLHSQVVFIFTRLYKPVAFAKEIVKHTPLATIAVKTLNRQKIYRFYTGVFLDSSLLPTLTRGSTVDATEKFAWLKNIGL